MARLAHIICLIGMSCWIAAASSAQGTPIGDRGATAVLSDSWVRQELDPNMGDNQFLVKEGGGLLSRRKQAFAVVLESEVLLETPEDFERMFDSMALYGHDTRVEVYEGTRFTLGSRRFDAEVNGLKLAYRLELLSRGGLTYYLMAWSTQTQRDFLNQKVEQFLAGFQFPPQSSAWHREAQPVERTVSVEDFDLSFSVRPFILREEPRSGDQLISLASPEGDHGVFVFEMENMTAEEMLAASFAACGDGADDFIEVARKDLRVEGVEGRMMIAKDETHSFHLLALPLEDGRVLDVRYVAAGSPETHRADRDLFFKTLRLDRRASVISLPEPVEEFEVVPLERNARTVFDRSKLLGDTTLAYAKSVWRLPDGMWLSLGWGSASLLTEGGTAETLLEADGFTLSSMTRWRNRWFIANSEEEVREVDNGTLLPVQPFAARCLASLGDDLLLVRSAASQKLSGYSSYSSMGGDVLVRRRQPGNETVIAELPHAKVSMIVANAAGTSALLLVERRRTPWTDGDPNDSTCLEVDLRSGAVREMGAWQSVDAVALADRGWLVTGRPQGLPRGIYTLRGAGDVAAVITGERIVGVELADSNLVYTSDLRSTGAQPYLLYEVRIDEISGVGPLCQAFSSQHLNRIGDRVVDLSENTGAPRTEAELRKLIDKAQGVAGKLVGTRLPTTGVGVDTLISEVYDTRTELEPAGRALLAMLVTVANLDQGAGWVAGAAHSWTDWLVPSTVVTPTAFAIGYSPANLLTSVLDDGEGSWNPGTSAMELAEGRRVFFGLDAEALRASTDDARPAGVTAALDSGRVRDIREILEQCPDNVFFRTQVWEYLITAGRTGVVEELAQGYASRGGAELVDLRAWLAAWNHRVNDPQQAEQLARAAWQAFSAHPSDAQLCQLLGSAYEKAKPAEPDYARTCYQRVLRIQQWGAVAEEAQEALERLPR